jgi:hypothetical protein
MSDDIQCEGDHCPTPLRCVGAGCCERRSSPGSEKRNELADRIGNAKLGWLPTVGEVVNVTFDTDEARTVIAALRGAAAQPAPALREALDNIRVISVGADSYVSVTVPNRGFWSVQITGGHELFDLWQLKRDQALALSSTQRPESET